MYSKTASRVPNRLLLLDGLFHHNRMEEVDVGVTDN
jgi:hypothetical protein